MDERELMTPMALATVRRLGEAHVVLEQHAHPDGGVAKITLLKERGDADAILAVMTIRAFRGHFSPEDHRGVELGGIYWHFVDVMWVVVYFTVYIF